MYSVTITNALNCSIVSSVSVNSLALALSDTASNPGCGSNSGTGKVAPLNATGPFTYLWSNGATTNMVSNLAAGNYYVTVHGAQGCSAVDSISLLAPDSISVSFVVESATCNNSDAGITATVTGTTGPFNYLWSNGLTGKTISGLAPGNYSVTVSGGPTGSPFWTEDFTNGGAGWTLNVPGQVANGNYANQWIINSDVYCTCGSGNYLHVTCDPSALQCTDPGACIYLGLPAGFGNYVTDMLAISPTISTIGRANIYLRFNWESLGNHGFDYGLVKISADGGTTWLTLPTQYVDTSYCTTAFVAIPVNYQNIPNFRIAFEWVNISGTFGGNNGNPPGFVIDNISLTSANVICNAVANVNVVSSSPLSIVTASTPAGCLTGGTAVVDVTVGSGPFHYNWSNYSQADSIAGLAAGSYSVTVNDAHHCSATSSTIVTATGGAIDVSAISTAAHCGLSDGSATVSASGGSGQYAYYWSNGGSAHSILQMPAGYYQVTVSDSNHCSASAVVDVGTLALPPVAITQDKTIMCPGDTATLCAPSGFTRYHWSTGDTSRCMITRQPGNYSIVVTNSNNCTASSNVDVVSLFPQIMVSLSIFGDTLVINSTDQTNYQWYFNNVAIPGADSAILIATQTGQYYATAVDANGCKEQSYVQNIAVTGINALTVGDGIKVYPNPLQNGNWHLEVSADWIGGQVEIYDAIGRTVYSNIIRQEKSDIEFNAACGIYLIQIVLPQRNFAAKLIRF